MASLLRQNATLVVSTAVFAVLALDIAFPAVILSGMAVLRWLLAEVHPDGIREVAA